MHCTTVKFELLLTLSQNQQHLNVCLEFCEMANDDPAFNSRTFMDDEIWGSGMI